MMTEQQIDIVNYHMANPDKFQSEIADVFGIKKSEVNLALRSCAVTIAIIKQAFREKDRDFIRVISTDLKGA